MMNGYYIVKRHEDTRTQHNTIFIKRGTDWRYKYIVYIIATLYFTGRTYKNIAYRYARTHI